jgi:hypothetical protein
MSLSELIFTVNATKFLTVVMKAVGTPGLSGRSQAAQLRDSLSLALTAPVLFS